MKSTIAAIKEAFTHSHKPAQLRRR